MLTPKKSLALACLLLLMAPTSWAEGAGKIQPDWNIYGDGNLFFYLSGPHNNSACPQIPERWAFDTTTPVGKSWLAAFLAAYSSGKEIIVEGSGACIHGNTEGVFNMRVR